MRLVVCFRVFHAGSIRHSRPPYSLPPTKRNVSMAKLPIVQGDVPILRKKSAKVGRIDGRIVRLANDLHETLANVAGVGLAAPQVSVLERVVTIRVPENYLGEEQPEIVLTL